MAGKGIGPVVEWVRTVIAGNRPHEAAHALVAPWQPIKSQTSIPSDLPLILGHQDQTVKRMMTAPGVKALAALAYVSAIDDLQRLANSSGVGMFGGLTPWRFLSGEDRHTSRISKHINA